MVFKWCSLKEAPMEKPVSEEAREIRAQARQVALEAAKLPLGAVRAWIEKMEEAQRLFEFAKWLE
jgi:hypothetical protein